jgi:hypothetical protein
VKTVGRKSGGPNLGFDRFVIAPYGHSYSGSAAVGTMVEEVLSPVDDESTHNQVWQPLQAWNIDSQPGKANQQGIIEQTEHEDYHLTQNRTEEAIETKIHT